MQRKQTTQIDIRHQLLTDRKDIKRIAPVSPHNVFLCKVDIYEHVRRIQLDFIPMALTSVEPAKSCKRDIKKKKYDY